MTVSKIGAPVPPAAQPIPAPVATPAPAAKNDHDGDDGAGASAAAIPPAGQGSRVDTKA